MRWASSGALSGLRPYCWCAVSVDSKACSASAVAYHIICYTGRAADSVSVLAGPPWLHVCPGYLGTSRGAVDLSVAALRLTNFLESGVAVVKHEFADG